MTVEDKKLLNDLLTSYFTEQNKTCNGECSVCDMGVMLSPYDNYSCAINIVKEQLGIELNSNKPYTGFKDENGTPIYVGDVVQEGCNGLISCVVWDTKQGTYKMQGLGDYYIKDAGIEWTVLKIPDDMDFVNEFNIPQDGGIMSAETQRKIQAYFNQ